MEDSFQRWRLKVAFIGQLTASVGFSVYSYLLDNWVFLLSNVALLCTAVIGEWPYLQNKKNPPEVLTS